ncbi:CLUMA_CG015477, isoform A [Clunio marinus]|uniref:CLUMA_CG015477, isoform A n=1 Tax=Clunio marinus TaxID=568069 RepID=A0A1J1IPL9_9DIPT|nr:CLUMA_CG015477, isoform A [Clunio marinus]
MTSGGTRNRWEAIDGISYSECFLRYLITQRIATNTILVKVEIIKFDFPMDSQANVLFKRLLYEGFNDLNMFLKKFPTSFTSVKDASTMCGIYFTFFRGINDPGVSATKVGNTIVV